MQTAEIRSTREVREDSPVLLESQAIHKQVKETEKDQPGYRREIREIQRALSSRLLNTAERIRWRSDYLIQQY